MRVYFYSFHNFVQYLTLADSKSKLFMVPDKKAFHSWSRFWTTMIQSAIDKASAKYKTNLNDRWPTYKQGCKALILSCQSESNKVVQLHSYQLTYIKIDKHLETVH